MRTLELPNNIPLTVSQVAPMLGCSTKTVRNYIKRYLKNPTDRYGLKARRNSVQGPHLIYPQDLKDYLERTEVGFTIKIAA